MCVHWMYVRMTAEMTESGGLPKGVRFRDPSRPQSEYASSERTEFSGTIKRVLVLSNQQEKTGLAGELQERGVVAYGMTVDEFLRELGNGCRTRLSAVLADSYVVIDGTHNKPEEHDSTTWKFDPKNKTSVVRVYEKIRGAVRGVPAAPVVTHTTSEVISRIQSSAIANHYGLEIFRGKAGLPRASV